MSNGFVDILFQTLYALYILFFLVVPIFLGYFFWKNWVKYVRAKFLAEQKYILLELRVPKEVTKNPAAMELFITALYQGGGEGTWYDKYFLGGMRPWFSLELASIEGQVKFFIWSRVNFRKVIESQLYSQYPEIEIIESEDYSKNFHLDGTIELWGCNFEKTQPSFYPIKTYIDYGLDMDPKEEYKVDPITPVIEYMGGLGSGEQAWIQILIRTHKKEFKKPGTWFEKVDWKHFAKEEIKEKIKKVKSGDDEEDEGRGRAMTKGEKTVIESIERSVSKLAFDTGIRAIYLAKKEIFTKASIAGLTGSFRQYNSANLNSFAPENTTSFDYPWQDFRNIRLNEKKRKMLNAYINRAFFKPIYTGKHFVLNSEELATIYHFPGGVSKTPTFTRIVSRKAEAPANLPT